MWTHLKGRVCFLQREENFDREVDSLLKGGASGSFEGLVILVLHIIVLLVQA